MPAALLTKMRYCANDFIHVVETKFANLRKEHSKFSRVYRSVFGVTPTVTAVVWNKISNQLNRTARPEHLLWTLHFLKNYSTEHVNSVLWKCDEKQCVNGYGILFKKYAI